jgi:excisionase family DNA binding protein
MQSQILLNGITIEQLVDAIRPLLPIQNKECKGQDDELLTREEVCQFLNITKTTLWKLTKNGKYKSYGVGNRILYKKSELLLALTPLNH